MDVTTDLMPDTLAEVLPSIEAARQDKNPLAYSRYSSADCEWYVLGYDPETDTALCLFTADQTIEPWPIGEFEDLAYDHENRVVRDLGFTPRRLNELDAHFVLVSEN